MTTRKPFLRLLLKGWCVFVALGSTLMAQTQGLNAVWGANVQQASSAFIDASVFGVTTDDICTRIYDALTSVPLGTPGTIVDARGISTNLTCTSGTPWVQKPNSTTNPSTILLPAETIVLTVPWVLPDRTRLVGEHPTDGSVSTLQATTGFTTDSTDSMIEMGSSSLCPVGCTGISIEHVTLNIAQELPVHGIYNAFAGDESYVNDVALTGMTQTGLFIAASGSLYSSNSGPYTHINFLSDDNFPVGGCTGQNQCPTCAQFQVPIRGFRNITCIGSKYTNTAGFAAIYVNASNTSVEDVHIESFWDGVQVGNDSSATMGNIVINNVDGATKGCQGHHEITNLIHLCGSELPNNRTGCSSGSGPLSNTTVIGVKLESGSSGSAVLEDDVTNTVILQPTSIGFPFTLGFYDLGNTVAGTANTNDELLGYSRITNTGINPGNSSSPYAVPTWGIGTGPLSGSCKGRGTIYSNTQGTGSSYTLYVCTTGGWQPII